MIIGILTFMELFFKIIVLTFGSIILHELGHFFYFRWVLKKNVAIMFYYDEIKKHNKLRTGYIGDYFSLTPREKTELYLAGILTGLLPILVFFSLNIFYGLVLPAYLWGCKKDLKNIMRLIKQWKKQKHRTSSKGSLRRTKKQQN